VEGDKLEVYRSPEVAARYDERWRGARGRRRDERKRRAIEAALGRFAGARTVLDVPCGTGRFAAMLRARGLGYAGADASGAMLGVARAKAGGAAWIRADLSRLPFADRSFDVALCVRLMHLVRERELRLRFLRELARVARLGVIVDYRQDRAVRVWIDRARARLGLREREPGALPLEEIEAELAEAGMDVRAFVPVRRVPYSSAKVVVAAGVR
jgi:ubiquinone/menaquinone biosynthesis C-methylase UbiE